MASRWGHRSGVELERLHRALVDRAALERLALQGATEDMQAASDRIARVVVVVVALARSYWLPVGALAVAAFFERTRPALRLARTGFAIWQIARLLQGTRR